MKTTKRKMLFHSFYDHTGIEAHLDRMAEQGWLLDKIGTFFWHYRRIEPQKLTFSVSYFPKASRFDPGPTEEQETFYDFCAHTGWTLAAASAQLQVFYNEQENPVPIDTDPALEVDAIHRSAKRGWLISMFLFLGLAVFEEAMFAVQLLNRPLDMLCNPYAVFAAVCYIALFLLAAVELTTYYSWRRRAKRAAEQGEFLPTRSHPMLQKLALAVVLIGMVWCLSYLRGGLLTLMLVYLVCTFGIVFVVMQLRELLKRKKVSTGVNRVVTLGACVVLPVILVTLVLVFTLRTGGFGQEDSGRLPLTLPELLGVSVDDENWDRDLDVTQSPLLGYLTARQYLWTDDGASPLWLSYSVAVVKAPFLYGLCKDKMLSRYDTRERSSVPEGQKMWYEPTDPAPWGAEEAYQRYFQSAGADDSVYLLCYPDRIVEIDFDWAPTPAQMAVVGEKLGGG